MRLHEKILKDINDYCKQNRMGCVPTEDLKYQIDQNDKIRAAYALLKADGFIELIGESRVKFVERRDACTVYFEHKRQNLRNHILTPIIVSVLTNLIIALLKWLLPPILQWLSTYFFQIAQKFTLLSL